MSSSEQILREFIRDCLTEKLAGFERSPILGQEERQTGLETTFSDIYGSNRACTEPIPDREGSGRRRFKGFEKCGVAGSLMNLLGQPEEAFDVWKDIFGEGGFFNLSGLFDTQTSPFGEDISTIGRFFWESLEGIMSPNSRDAGGELFPNFTSAANFNRGSGTSPALREAITDDIDQLLQEPAPEDVPEDVPEEAPEAPVADQGLSDEILIGNLSRDIEGILAKVSAVKASPDVTTAVQSWHDLISSSVDTSGIRELEDSMSGSPETSRARDVIANDVVPTFLTSLFDKVKSGIMHPTSDISASLDARETMVSMLDNALSSIRS